MDLSPYFGFALQISPLIGYLLSFLAIIDILLHFKKVATSDKAVWILVSLLGGSIGAAIYFLFGRRILLKKMMNLSAGPNTVKQPVEPVAPAPASPQNPSLPTSTISPQLSPVPTSTMSPEFDESASSKLFGSIGKALGVVAAVGGAIYLAFMLYIVISIAQCQISGNSKCM